MSAIASASASSTGRIVTIPGSRIGKEPTECPVVQCPLRLNRYSTTNTENLVASTLLSTYFALTVSSTSNSGTSHTLVYVAADPGAVTVTGVGVREPNPRRYEIKYTDR